MVTGGYTALAAALVPACAYSPGALFAESLAERAQHVIIFSVASWQVHTASLQRLA